MKNRALAFVFMAMLILSIVPAVNLKFKPREKGDKWWTREFLYSLDFALPFLNRTLYPLGISTSPSQVMIGKEGWLYLGDRYRLTVSVKRREANAADIRTARKIGEATKAWESRLQSRGVRLFRIMIGPDKDSVYPEFLPDWDKSASNSAMDALLANVDPDIYIDTRPALQEAKTRFSFPLYYKTDTHWNSLGAWIAFRAFMKKVNESDPSVHCLSDDRVSVLKERERKGGDLANFLRLKPFLKDKEIITAVSGRRPAKTEEYEFGTDHLIEAKSAPAIEAPRHPVLVKSENALNHKKVLWLHDSFGSAMSPFMETTFSEILQLHYEVTDPDSFAKLVDTFKPDYVFITVVERGARSSWFENFPPAQ